MSRAKVNAAFLDGNSPAARHFVECLYRSEAEARCRNRRPTEIVFHPDDVDGPYGRLIGIDIHTDPEMAPGTFRLRDNWGFISDTEFSA